jgi:hypothetical protein
MPAITVDFHVEPADRSAWAAERRHFYPKGWAYAYYYGIVPVILVGLAVVVGSFSIAAIFTVLLVGSGWLVQYRIEKAYRHSVREFIFDRSRWHVTLSDEGICFSTDITDHFYSWYCIRQVVRGTKYIHFEITPLNRLYIPVRAFSNESHILGFITAAESHLRKQTPQGSRIQI